MQFLSDISISLFRPPNAEWVFPRKAAGADTDYLILAYFWQLLVWNNLKTLLGQSIQVMMENNIWQAIYYEILYTDELNYVHGCGGFFFTYLSLL